MPPALADESAGAYRRRITAANAVPELDVVYHEHPFWTSLGNIVKRWQTMMGIAAIIMTTVYTTTKANKLIDEVAAANEKLKKLDDVVTSNQLKKSVDDLVPLCSAKAAEIATAELKKLRYVVRGPNYQTRGKPWDGRIVDLQEPEQTRER